MAVPGRALNPVSGARLGKYEVRGTLGKGAMGTVYDGWDPAIDRRVAIKTVHLPDANDPETQAALARFKREAQAAGRLSHPNIVGVFDYGEMDELAYIVMEFVEGSSLKERLAADERLPLSEALRLMDDVLAGLAYSHARGVVHRDVKPANVMIAQDGRAKLADFGIARIESSSMTQAGTVMGTPAYMSPEQFMGQVVDRRTDIYSSGVLLYQLLTGERPFDGGLTTIMHKALHTVPPRPSELSVTAPPGLDAVVARAMARRPEDRYSSVEDFAWALHQGVTGVGDGRDDRAGLDATVIAPRPTLQAPPAKPAALPRQPGKKPMLAGGALALLALAGAGAWLLRPAAPPPTPLPMAAPEPPRTEKPGQLAAPAVLPPSVSAPAAPPSADPASMTPLPAIPPNVPIVPPAAEPVAIPPAAVPPARPTSAVRAALAAAVTGLRCTLASGDLSETGLASIAGLAGAGEPQESLRRAVDDAGLAATDWRVATFDGPYCHALDTLRPIAGGAGPAEARAQLSFPDGGSALPDNALIAFNVTLPNFAGYVQVDYLQADGRVMHLVPSAAYPHRTFAAGARAELGRPRPDFDGWRVGAPFGIDMITAIVSTAPLFAQARPEEEPAAAYLRDLQAAMDAIRRRGGSLAASAMLLDTRP